MIGSPSFQERLLTEEEKQKIDIDSIVNTLDNSIEEIISKKIYRYYNFKICGISSELYISHYYLFLYLNYKGNNTQIDYLSGVCDVFDRLKDFKTKLTPQKISLISSYHAQADTEQLWTVFDKEAFPLMESSNLVNGRYADQHLYAPMSIDLIREIRKGYNEGNEQEERYDVNITSYATEEISSVGDIDFHDIFSNMLKNSNNEVTRCFNSEFAKQ